MNDLLDGFRVGANIFNQAAQLKEQRESRKARTANDELRAKLEQERNDLSRDALASNDKFRDLDHKLNTQREARVADNEQERLAQGRDHLSAKLKEFELRKSLVDEQVAGMQYERKQKTGAAKVVDRFYAEYDELDNTSRVMKKYLLENPGEAGTATFEAIKQRLGEVEREKQSVLHGSGMEWSLIQAVAKHNPEKALEILDKKEARIAQQESLENRVGLMDTVTTTTFTDDGNEVKRTQKVPAGSEFPPKMSTSAQGGATAGQQSAFSQLGINIR